MKLLAKMGILGLLAGAAATTVVYGEPQGGWLSPNGQNAASASNGAAGATLGARGSMTLLDMRTRGQSLHEQSRLDARHIQHLQQIARQAKDVIKLNCVNEKLTAVKGLLKMSEQADVAMQEALARRDEETSRDEYDKITIARGKVDQLLSESEACVGELSVYTGDTIVEMVGGDTGEIPSPPPTTPDVAVRPPAASNGENG